MSMTSKEIGRAARALSPWIGAHLQGVHQPAPELLVLELRRPGATLCLLAHCRGDTTRIHPINRRPPNPENPHGFQQLLRKELSGSLISLRQENGDRVLSLQFEGTTSRRLILELTGRHGNAVLLDEVDRVLGLLLPNLSQRRTLAPGLPYVPVAVGGGTHARRDGDDRWADLPDEGFLAAVASFCEAQVGASVLDETRAALTRALRREHQKVGRLLNNLERELEEKADGSSLRRYGDLLQINLGRVQRGRPSVQVEDLFADPPAPLVIPLQPELSPQENLARFYRLARRHEAAVESLLSRAAAAEERLAELTSLQAAVEVAPDVPSLEGLRLRARVKVEAARAATRHPKAAPRLPYLRFRSRDGLEIRVGRGAVDNDALTFRHSAGNDVWLHARGTPGAHVVVPCGRGASPPLDTLLDAAALALKHAGRQEGDDGDVSWTHVKHVRRVPGGPPGRVTITHDRTLYVRLTPEALGAISRWDTDGAA